MSARPMTGSVLLLCVLSGPHQAAAQPLSAIRVDAGCVVRGGSHIAAFSAVLRNSGPTDVAVTIGVSLNGVVHHPTQLRVVVTDTQGTTDALHFSGGGVEGQIRPWVAVVPAGGLYRITIPIDRLFLGRHSVRRARFARIRTARVVLVAGPRALIDGEPATVPAGAEFASGEYTSDDIRVPSQCVRAH